MSSLHAVADDAMLLRAYAADGNAAAFAELVRRYADMVYATARRVTGSATAAEDVAQDCFLRLAQYSATITGSLAAWLHRTSLNRSLEVVRAEGARRRREVAVGTSPRDEHDESRELIARVDEALAGLPNDLRFALTEHFLCGKSQGDIAAGCGMSQSSISRRIDAGLKQLRQKLRTDVAAAALLPLLLQGGLREIAPQSVRAALTKIGLAGVRAAPTAAASALTSVAITAASIVVLGAGWFFIDRSHKPAAPPASPSAAKSPVASTTPATKPFSWLKDDEPDDDK